MAAKLLLCVSNNHATVSVWRRQRSTSPLRFENNEAGWSAFAVFLNGVRGLPVHIIVDTVEEDFRFETLPHIRGRDRLEMVGRKLRQLYRATPYFSYALQERETGKRRDDRYLFAALTNPDLLVPWLRGIESNGMPVSGIYPLALVSASLIDRLKLKQPNLLIVSKNSAGLRQTFFKNLKFRISRLTPLGDAIAMADQQYADEIGNTRMYLDALTVTHVDDILDVFILDQDGLLSALPAAITGGRPNIRCHYLDASEIASRFAISIADLKASSDLLHLHLLGAQTPSLNLAPPYLTRTYQLFAAGRWVYSASVAIFIGALVWGGVNVYTAMEIDQNASSLHRQIRDYQTKYQQVTAQFPEAPTSTENLRNTVDLAKQVRASLRTPESMFFVVSRALDATPRIQLSHLAWHYGSTPLDLESKSANATPDGRNRSGANKALVQSGIVRGELKSFNGDYKEAMALINNFATRLAADEMVSEVRALTLPLNTSSDVGLAGSTSATNEKNRAEFELAIVFKAGG